MVENEEVYKRNEDLNLQEIKNLVDKTEDETPPPSRIVGSFVDALKTNEGTKVEQPILVEDEPTKGLIIDTPKEDKPKESYGPTVGPIDESTFNNIDNYMKEMDEETERLKNNSINKVAEDVDASENEVESNNTIDVNDDDLSEDDFKKIYNESVVIIDKSNMGQIINFTDEERAKLERSKKIKLEEVETVSLETIKIKQSKKKNLDKVIEKSHGNYLSPIVAPISGYTAQMKGCSVYELITLIQDTNSTNRVDDLVSKWSLIYNKMVQPTSIGKLSFNEFLSNTSALDYNMFIFGLISSTYPDDDKIPLNCKEKECGKDFEFVYSPKSLMRVEKMSDKLKDLIANTVESSYTRERALENHNNSVVNTIKRIKLPDSGYIVEIKTASAYELIYKTTKESEKMDKKYEGVVPLTSMVRKIFTPDPDSEEGEYLEFGLVEDISKLIYSLKDIDFKILTAVMNDMFGGLNIDFGFMDIKCPHCGHYTAVLPIDLETILFYKYQQATSTKVE